MRYYQGNSVGSCYFAHSCDIIT